MMPGFRHVTCHLRLNWWVVTNWPINWWGQSLIWVQLDWLFSYCHLTFYACDRICGLQFLKPCHTNPLVRKTCLYLFFCSTSSMFLSIFFCHPNFFKRIHENLQQYKDICKCIEDQWYCKSSILHINKAFIPKIVNADKSVD